MRIPSTGTLRSASVTRPWRVLLLALGILATLLPPGAAPPAGAAGRVNGPLVPTGGFYVGAYTKHIDGYRVEKAVAAMDDLEGRLGRRLHINHHFYAWADTFPSWREPWDIEHGRIPMISWNGENTDAIARGDHDRMIAARALAVQELGVPVFIRWFWEMDGNKKQHYISKPASYVKAWRHIVDSFRAAGATNVVWVWCPNASAIANGKAMAYYPGPDYVDWVCGDGYNFAPNRPGDKWESFAEIYNGFYAKATKMNKPIMIGEFGVLERNPGEKEQWLRAARHWLESHPAVAAVVYFNADSSTNGIHFNWRVDTSESAFEGFRYLFSGAAPEKPATFVPGVAALPPPAVKPPLPAGSDQPAASTPPKQSKPQAGTPAATPGAPVESADSPSRPATPPAKQGREPSVRLTWVLQLLRQFDAAAVAT